MGGRFCPLARGGGPSSPFAYDAQSLGDSPLLLFSCFEHREGLHRFWTWLELVANESGRNILIAAHNGSGFDFPVLQSNMTNYGLKVPPSLCGKVQGADTCKAFRKLFSERGEPEQSCKLETLLQKFHPLWREKQAHDGLKDARDLKDLLGWVGVAMNLNPGQILSKAGQHLNF